MNLEVLDAYQCKNEYMQKCKLFDLRFISNFQTNDESLLTSLFDPGFLTDMNDHESKWAVREVQNLPFMWQKVDGSLEGK